MDQLANALRREHELLELVLFKLVETRLLLGASEIRFLPRATDEVERARQRAREADLVRAAVVERLGPQLGRGRPITLRGLADETDEPWAGILRDHHGALCGLVAEIELVAHQNARHARSCLQRTRADEPTLSGVVAVGALCRPTPDADLSSMADEAAFEAVLGAAARLRMPALLAFLR